MDAIEALGQFGLTRQEASLFVVLTSEGELSGYEAARQAGISRSNAYAALASLAEKGAVYRLDGVPPRYQALPVDEFCGHRLRGLRETAELLTRSIPPRRCSFEAYLTVEGRQNIVDRLRSMVAGAEKRIYLALPPSVVALAASELRAAGERGVKLVVVSSADPGLPGAGFHQRTVAEDQVRMIVDSSEVLTGDLGPQDQGSCLYSKRKHLVDLFKDALRNEIRLIELGAL